MRSNSVDSDSSSSSDTINGGEKFQAILQRQLKKHQTLERKKAQKEKDKARSQVKEEEPDPRKSQKFADIHSNTKAVEEIFKEPKEIRWYIHKKAPHIKFEKRVPHPINQLPIFKKKDEILDAITKNQFVLVTGETGCGKSTQVPRLLYEYLKEIGDRKSKIICVQPRRLAVMNLNRILERQVPERDLVGYQIGMKSNIQSSNRIVFVTNGIFLQRMIHSPEIFNEYPFIVLDQVHERDIDTDFILLTIKRIIRLYPKVRIILMSATIDNHLFRYYFASDHVDNILSEQNFYKKIIREKHELAEKKKLQQQEIRMLDQNDNEYEIQIDSDSKEEDQIYEKYNLAFMKSRYPCPAINVTEPGKFKRQFFYLDTLDSFLRDKEENTRTWGSAFFSQKQPSTNKELYESVCLVLRQVAKRSEKQKDKSSILIFMPGLAQIEQLHEHIRGYFPTELAQTEEPSQEKSDHVTTDKSKKQFQVIKVHSAILTDRVTKQLHQKTGKIHKIIIATNIAESSITVLGVQYVIDFCLSKEVRFDIKSKMENLELVWASQASCKQRAGRTGRVCDGYVIRMVEKEFYDRLPKYSTPQIQRSSLDRLVLRIKLLHEEQEKINQQKREKKEKEREKLSQEELERGQFAKEELDETNIFADPGEVLGSAIQPPNLKNIDSAINSLIFSGGLEWRGDTLILTNLGRFYVDIPIDITYSKMLVVSQLFGTFYDMLTLVSILSQSKNAIRRGTIEKYYSAFYSKFNNSYGCDFIGLLILYEEAKQKQRRDRQIKTHKQRESQGIDIKLQIVSEVDDLRRDLLRRIQKKSDIFPLFSQQQERKWNMSEYRSSIHEQSNYLLKFKLTITCGFIENMLKVRENTLDDKQEKRLRIMKRVGIQHQNTVCILNSQKLKRSDDVDQETKTQKQWKERVCRTFEVKDVKFTLTYGVHYMHFLFEEDLHKFLYYKSMEDTKKRVRSNTAGDKYNSKRQQLLQDFGELDHMNPGRVVNWRQQTVQIDNYSLNRVVNINEGESNKYLVTSNIAKQSSRMVAKYTSLLPLKVKFYETITNLFFYPFVSLSTTKQKSRYDYVVLSKRKHKVPIKYCLNNPQIKQVNAIRAMLKSYLSLTPISQQTVDFTDFTERVLDFLFKERKEIKEEEKWQDLYLKELFESEPEMKQAYKAFKQKSALQNAVEQSEKDADRNFINEIKPDRLGMHYFSEEAELLSVPIEQRIERYNEWKRKKLSEVRQIERKVADTDSYLACGIPDCAARICKMVKVAPKSEEVYREIFDYDEEDVKQVEIDTFESHFCSLLISNYIEHQYKVYGCKNGHHFAVKASYDSKIKLCSFSNMIIVYPDGSAEQADFDKLDVKDWKRKHDKKLRERGSMKVSTHCFICDQTLQTFKALEMHIGNGKHKESVEAFMKTLPEDMRIQPLPKKIIEDDSYY